jgi:hypothetical protein
MVIGGRPFDGASTNAKTALKPPIKFPCRMQINGSAFMVPTQTQIFVEVGQRICGKYRFEVHDVEPEAVTAAIANKFGVPTYCGTNEAFVTQSSKKFYAITTLEVFEHVSDLFSVVASVWQVLKKKGALILGLSNFDDPYCLKQQMAPVIPPIHINYMLRNSPRAVLHRAGLFTLPIPSSSVRNIYGVILLAAALLGVIEIVERVDGATSLIMQLRMTAKPCRF